MKKLTLVMLAAFSLTFLPEESHAASSADGGFMLGVSFMKLDTSTSGPSLGNNDSSTTVLDLKAGTTLSGGIYVGGIYDMRTDETNGSKQERTGFGATIGYHNAGWFIDGSYYFSSKIKLTSGSELKEGSGFGVDVGHNFEVTSNIYLGLQVSYKSFTYTKLNAADETNKIKSELMPMLNVGVTF